MKKFCKTALVTLLALLAVFAVTGCGNDESGNGGTPSVSYGTAVVNYHYETNALIETYWQEKYMVPTGTVYSLTEFYTPDEKLGYRFLGWTETEGGEGEVLESFDIEGEGGSGKSYDLYAKWEVITFQVVYHLNGGVNSSNNPATVTGSAKLYDPTKQNAEFKGWYYDADFEKYASKIELESNDQTTVNLYAKWRHTYTISYVSNIGNLAVSGDTSHKSYKEDFAEAIYVKLYGREFFEGYCFLGWTYEGQTEPVLTAEVTIEPGTTGDLVFTANYLKATDLEVTFDKVYDRNATFTVPAGTDEIVIADVIERRLAGAGIQYRSYSKITVRYHGDTEPTVVCSSANRKILNFEKIAD